LAKKASSPVEDMKKFIAKKGKATPKPIVKAAAPKLLDDKRKAEIKKKVIAEAMKKLKAKKLA
jgi:hypothetical protein